MRVERTFAFIDLCGFTAYTDAHGDRAAVGLLALLRARLRASAENHGVRVTKWLGDGAMLSGTERSHVVRCAAELREVIANESALPMRGGIAGGPVIMFEGDDYIGAAVNIAARLCDRAEPNQLLVAVRPGCGGEDVNTRSLGRLSVKGLSGPVDVHAVLAVREAAVLHLQERARDHLAPDRVRARPRGR